MVPGAARRMGGCSDIVYGSGVTGSCVPPNLCYCCLLLCTFLYHLSNFPLSSAIRRNAVDLAHIDPMLGRKGR